MSTEGSNALRDRAAILTMADTEGWRVFCLRHAELVKDLEQAVWNAKNPVEAEGARQARIKIDADFLPRVVVHNLVAKLDAVIKREMPKTQQIGSATPTP